VYSLRLLFRSRAASFFCCELTAAASIAAAFKPEYPFFLIDGDGDRVPLVKTAKESSREALDMPRERGRWSALCHGPGESLITSGDGSGVMSPSAFKAGEDSAEAGDNEPRLAVDQADLR
jgi:hypothetical protein